ncbi:unnamed protein product, partial [marine sediment metagenome]
MYLPQKHYRNKNHSVLLGVLFLFFILSFPIFSLANNDEFITYKVT